MSDFTTRSVITVCYKVCSHYTALAHLTYGESPPPPTHTHALRCQGLLSPGLTQCYLRSGCRVSLLRRWDPVRTGKIFYVVGCFLWFPIQHRDSLIFLNMCACHRKYLTEHFICSAQRSVPARGQVSNLT